MNQPFVYIIIPHRNGPAILAACLSSLKQIEYKNYQIIVVDDCSQDNSAEFVQANFPEVILLQNKANNGFAASCNKGIKYALEKNADFILLLNNDTEVAPDFLDKMVVVVQGNKVGIVGAKIYYFDEPGKIWFAGGKFVWWRVSGKHYFWQRSDNPNLTGVRDSEFITGCVMLIKRKVFDDIGLFFEPFFLTVEDLDFSYRARQKGWQIKTALDARVWHKVSASRAGEFSFSNGYYGTRNRLYFGFKRVRLYLSGFIFLCIVAPIRIGQWILQGRWQMAKGAILGILDFFRGKMGSF